MLCSIMWRNFYIWDLKSGQNLPNCAILEVNFGNLNFLIKKLRLHDHDDYVEKQG